MANETHFREKKSLRKIEGASTNWPDLAQDVVAFATAKGGKISVGIEDGQNAPPIGQLIPASLIDKIRKRIGELTVNVHIEPELITASNGGQFIEIHIPRSIGVPSTTSGLYLIREGDRNRRITGDDVLRLAQDRTTFSWEGLPSFEVLATQYDSEKLSTFTTSIRNSDRVKSSVKVKTDSELIRHYGMSNDTYLTNLGILLIGKREDRANLGTAPVVQVIKFDEQGNKQNKLNWDEYDLNPVELVTAIWKEVPDFRDYQEIRDGMLPRQIPAYDERVVRELLVNALVHRPYTSRGDIFINFHPDRMEIVNPGPLPIGVTPATILHTTARRNDNLARIFHDLNLMEKEGTGFDTIYQVLLAQGRPVPIIHERADRVSVTITRRIIKTEIIDLMNRADEAHQLNQREKICLGLLAQHEQMTARELATELMLGNVAELTPWFGRLEGLGLINTTGKTKGKRYFVVPDVLRDAKAPTSTTLQRIEPHRLHELIKEDLRRYPRSTSTQIRKRIGPEIFAHTLRRALTNLHERGIVDHNNAPTRARMYWLHDQNSDKSV